MVNQYRNKLVFLLLATTMLLVNIKDWTRVYNDDLFGSTKDMTTMTVSVKRWMMMMTRIIPS